MALSEKLKSDLKKLSGPERADIMLMTGIVAIADSKAERSVKIDAAQALIMLYRVLISIDLARTCLTDDGKNILETEKTLLILSEFFIEGHNRLKPAQQQAALLIEALGENPTDEAERK